MFLQACVIKLHTVKLKALRSGMAKMLIQIKAKANYKKSQLYRDYVVSALFLFSGEMILPDIQDQFAACYVVFSIRTVWIFLPGFIQTLNHLKEKRVHVQKLQVETLGPVVPPKSISLN